MRVGGLRVADGWRSGSGYSTNCTKLVAPTNPYRFGWMGRLLFSTDSETWNVWKVLISSSDCLSQNWNKLFWTGFCERITTKNRKNITIVKNWRRKKQATRDCALICRSFFWFIRYHRRKANQCFKKYGIAEDHVTPQLSLGLLSIGT